MAAPSAPAGSSAAKKSKSLADEEKSARKHADEPGKSHSHHKKEAEADRSPKTPLNPLNPASPVAPGNVTSRKREPDRQVKKQELEDIEKMLEEREEPHTAATVFFRTGLTQKLKKKFHVAKIAPLPTSPPRSPQRTAARSPTSPVSPSSPLSPPSPVRSPVLSGTHRPGASMQWASAVASYPCHHKVLIAVALLLVAAGASLLSLTLWTTIIPKRHVNYACKTPICEQVMKQILEYADPAIDPCDDFYSHVCGHWLRKKEGSTFMSDARKHFVTRRHELLTSPFNSSEPNSHVVETAHAFYRSCLKMFNAPVELKTALHELYTALNVSVKEWLGETRWQKFFADSFELSLKNHFHSVFKINHYNTKNGSYYVLAIGWSFYKHMRRSVPSLETNEYFRRVLEKIGDTPPPTDLVSELIQLDTTWDARAEMKGAPRSPARVGDLSCGAFTADVWAARFADHGAHSDTAVVTRNFGLTCSFMEAVLQNASALARPLYLLALVSGHILTYDFQMAVSSRAEELLMDVCQQGALHLFGEMWLHALSMTLSLKRPNVQDVKNFTNFGKRLQRVVRERGWMSAEDREMCAERLGGFTVTTFPDSVMSIHQLECSRFGQGDKSLSRLVLSNTFIKNFVNIYKVEMSSSCLEDQTRAMSPSTLRVIVGTNIAVDLSKRSVIVPQFLGAEPLFYVGDVDKFINIGTLTTLVAIPGARLAMRRFADFPVIGVNESAQRQWSAQTLGEYENIQHCLTKGYKPHGKRLSETGFDEVLAIMDGIEVAKNTKNEFDDEDVHKDKRRQFATDALFFRRACLTLCASETADYDINEVEYNMAHAGCNYGVGRLEQFHQAFGCGEKERMWAVLQCFDKYRAKDADVI